ncbi:MAG: hypothetical protein IPN34_03345 [Planctomycetes bacterium]|nr:hypothetical protein [Planctomycetota bacterium]
MRLALPSSAPVQVIEHERSRATRAAAQRAGLRAALLSGLAAACGLSACRSGPPSTDALRALPPAPYKTLLVFSAKSVEMERSLTAFWQRLAGLLQWYGTFADLDWIEAHRVRERAQSERIDEGTLLRRLAASRGFDRVIFVWLDAGEIVDQGPNWNAVPGGISWLGLGVPGFFFNDRSYSGAFVVGTDVMAADGNLQRPQLQQVELPELRMNFLERGFTPWCIVVPPFLLEGDAEDWSATAKSTAEDQLVRTLVSRWKVPVLAPSDVRFRFETGSFDHRAESALLNFTVESDEELERVELLVNGATLGQWGRVGLSRRRDELPGGGVAYRFEFQVPIESGEALVRVLASTAKALRTGSHALRRGGRS